MANKIARNSVVLAHLSEQISNRRLLSNLCLVNREFYAVFVKQLYRCIRLDGRSTVFFLDRTKRKLVIQSDKLMYTNILVIAESVDDAFSLGDSESSDESSDDDEHYTVEADEEADEEAVQIDDEEYEVYERKYVRLNRCVLDLVQNCPNLYSFARCSYFALDHNCMKALANLRRLDSLSVTFPEDEDPDSDVKTYLPEDIDQNMFQGQSELQQLAGYTVFGQEIYLPRFTDLHKLSLLKIDGDAGIWRTAILQVFLQSPQLQHLSLSKGQDPAASDGDGLDMESWFGLFEWICQQYSAILGKPVTLKTLRLGYCFRLPDLIKFHGIMGTECLERLSLTVSSEDLVQWEILSRLISPSTTPSLKQLSCGYVEDSDTLRAVITNDRPDLAFHASWTINFQLDEQGLPHFLLDACFDKRLASLSFRLCPKYTEYPALNHMKDCKWVTHVAVVVEESFSASYEHIIPNHLPFILKMVANLPKLEALWVVYGWSWTSSYHRRKIAEDIRDVALHITSSSTTLRYLRLGRTAWRAHRNTGGLVLEELDEWEDEVEGPELFHVPSPLHWSDTMDHFDW